jgi:hypothetical protein
VLIIYELQNFLFSLFTLCALHLAHNSQPQPQGALQAFKRMGCTHDHEAHFCMAQRYATTAGTAAQRTQRARGNYHDDEAHAAKVQTKGGNKDKCMFFLRTNCEVEKGVHCQLHCNSQRWDQWTGLQCGEDVSKLFCKEKTYRDTTPEAAANQRRRGEGSCQSRLDYFCNQHKNDPGECGVCAGRLWHELSRLKCSMGVVKQYCEPAVAAKQTQSP